MSPLYAGADLADKSIESSQPHTLQSPVQKDAHIPTSFAVTDVSFTSPVKLNTKFQHKPQPQSSGPQHLNDNRNKRSRSEFAEDEAAYAYDMDYGSGQNKRYKMDGPDKYPASFSPAPVSNESFHDYDPNTLSQGNNEGTLDKLLGRDADAFVEEHMDNYEVLIEKWKNCTMDEWIAGVDTIMVKYSKILEFVKTHMTYAFMVPSNLVLTLRRRSTKLKLFASFDKQVDSHGVVLEERQKVLAGVKQRFMSESGNILGRDKS
ncbi:hypothetical protein EDD18DRAFT_1107533 [Armillaria luteobubalina]|uniref:Extracellular mutant protein 11 C-terminal domain-containing protein n=1 Tax=Armillaria luteobubalina TaxID=153913 RepID=A0AA39Q0U0_9AGAR|nr:hypothetical protein EDD18DRAFT_1107533 [Armillaria luteobubalina]